MESAKISVIDRDEVQITPLDSSSCLRTSATLLKPVEFKKPCRLISNSIRKTKLLILTHFNHIPLIVVLSMDWGSFKQSKNCVEEEETSAQGGSATNEELLVVVSWLGDLAVGLSIPDIGSSGISVDIFEI